MAKTGTGTGFFTQFTGQFWLVNLMELFERGAYYAFMSVFSLHIVFNLGGSEELPGLLYGPMIAFLYFVPILAAALAEKFGYRNVLIVAFIMMIMGYSSMVFMNNLTGFIGFSIVFMGIGAGAFKPMISATIAHITREEQRNAGYSIYYWMINFGATIFPLSLTAYLYFKYPGIPWEDLPIYGAPMIFTVSTIFVTVNLFLALFVYKNPVRPFTRLNLLKAIGKIKPAFQDKKFVILLAIYAGFWFMFAFNHTYLPLYMYQFAKMPAWFTVTILATVNPGTIIILGPFLAKIVDKQDSLKMMILGILLFCTGLMIVAFTVHPAMFIAGIVVFSIGEYITHPNFISYVSKFAPKDKVAIYMACIFIPIGVGNIVGGFVQSQWYKHIAIGMHMPKLYIACVAAVGIATAVAFIIYNKWRFGMDVKVGVRKKAEGGFLIRPITPIFVIILVPVLIAAGAGGGVEEVVRESQTADGTDVGPVELVQTSQSFSFSGVVQENDEASDTFEFEPGNLVKVSVVLTWTDEGSGFVGGTNQPDELGFRVEGPNGESLEDGPSISGSVTGSENFSPDEGKSAHTGTWTFIVDCGDCGDDRSAIGFRTSADDSANFEMNVEFTYMAAAE